MIPAAIAAAPTARFQEKRETILAAAARHFNEQGVKGATLGGIAASVGLVTTSITYYYRRKEDLATACFERAIAAHRALAEQARGEATVGARVTRFFVDHAGWMADVDQGVRPALILFHDIRALPPPQAATVFAAYTEMFRSVRALLAGPETSRLGRAALNARAHLLLSVANAARLWYRGYEIDEYPRVSRQAADLLLHGLAAPGQCWPADPDLAAVRLDPPPAPADAGDDTADAFLRAATELVNEQGYPGASVDRISARLNVTKGSFYHHNETKLDLIAACFDRSFAVQRHTLRAAQRANGSAWLRCSAAAAALVRFQHSPRGPLLRSTAISALPDQGHRAQVRHTAQGLSERIAAVLVEGLVDGSIRPLNPAIAAQGLAAMINAAAELHRWLPGIDGVDVTRLYTRPALLGLLCND